MRKRREMKYSRYSYRIIVLLPIVVVILSLIASVLYNYYTSKNLLVEFSVSELSNMKKSSENKISSVVTVVKSLDSNSAISKYLMNRDIPFDEECVTALNNISKSFDYVDEVSVYNKKNSWICSTSGIYAARDYFTNVYKYDDLNYSYWQNIMFYISDEYRVLQPTFATDEYGNGTTVLPVVYRRHDNFSMKNLLVISIDLEKFLKYERSGEIVPEFSAYLFNKNTHDIFTWEGKVIANEEFPDEFYRKLLNSSSNMFSYELSGDNVIVATNSLSDTLYGYTYFSIIDNTTIIKKLLPSLLISLIILVAFVILYYIMLIPSLTYIYNPMQRINKVLSDSALLDSCGVGFRKKNDYLLYDIDSRVINLKERNDYLNTALQCAQEKYLFDFINSKDYYIDKKTRKVLHESLSFEYNYFAMVIMQLSPKKDLFDLYKSEGFINILNGFYKIVKDEFGERYPSFVLPVDRDVLYIIVNFRDNKSYMNVEDVIERIYGFLNFDLDLVDFYVGKSSAHLGFEGLREAAKEAKDDLHMHKDIRDRFLKSDLRISGDKINYSDEAALFAALMTSNTERCQDIIEKYITKSENVNDKEAKKKFAFIIGVLLKAVRLKGVPYKANAIDSQIINDILSLPESHIKEEIYKLLEFAQSGMSTRSSVEADKVIEYINSNYQNSQISLNTIATYFGCGMSTISEVVKNSVGVGFHEYVKMLRIDKAKDLLLSLDATIDDISKSCGFASKQTFYRAFKSCTGKTPSAYRNQ